MTRFLHILLLFSVLSVFGQHKNELKSQIAFDSIPEDKIERLLQLSTLYSSSFIDSSLYFIIQAEKFANELNNDSIDSRLRTHKAGILIGKQQFEEAERLLVQNVELSTIDSLTLAETIQNLGAISYYRQNLEQAVVHYLEASKIFLKHKDTIKLGKIFTNIGGIQARLKSPKKAIYYLEKALNYVDDNELLKMQVLINLSGAYEENNYIEKAIAATLKAEKIAKKNDVLVYLGMIYSNLCNFYLITKDYDVSISYGLKGLALKKQLDQNSDVILNNLGYAYLQQENTTQAFYYFEQILSTTNKELKPLLYNNLRETYENVGNYKEALYYANKYNAAQDSLNSSAQREQVDELVTKYESDIKQRQIDLLNTKDELNLTKLKQQRNFIWGLAIFSFLIIALGFLVYRNQRTNLSLKTAKIQHRLLQTQLNPHFLFHALSSIQSFIYQNKKEESVSYLSSFSKLMRSILNSSDQDFITVEEDVSALEDYLHLQRLNVTATFEKEIIVDEQIQENILIPPMFTQPFVENAIVHGIKNRTNGFINIAYKVDNDLLIITIQDNGKGINKDNSDTNKLNRSMSLGILNSRVQNLKQTHKYHSSIEVNSNKEGVIVTLKFPLRYKKL